ncbi:MAG: NosD domain-containing protein [Halodesulfovibrio sp.]
MEGKDMMDTGVRALHITTCLLTAAIMLVLSLPSVSEGADWTVVPVTEAGEVTIESSNTRLVLQNDITAIGSGVGFVAGRANIRNVEIDLNGHTIFFGTQERPLPDGVVLLTYNGKKPDAKQPDRNIGVHGIYSVRDPRYIYEASSFADQRWVQGISSVRIYSSRPGGRVVQGAGNAAYSSAIYLQGHRNVTIGGDPGSPLELEVSGADSYGIGAGGCTAVSISYLKITQTGRHVSNRHQIIAAISLGKGLVKKGDPDGTVYSEVHHTELIGSPQSGIKTAGYARIHDNIIRQNAVVTNCYGVQGWESHDVEVYDNRILPDNGRGIHLSERTENWYVHDNLVVVHENTNEEYGSKYQVHGIKVEDVVAGRVENNRVIAITRGKTSAHAFDINIKPTANVVVKGNSFIGVKRDEDDARACAVSLLAGDGTGVEFSGNRLYSNDAVVQVGPYTTAAFRLQGNEVAPLPDSQEFPPVQSNSPAFVYFRSNNKPLGLISFVDTVFSGVDYAASRAEACNVVSKEYVVARSTSFRLQGAGTQAAGASVRMECFDGGHVVEGVAGKDGALTLAVPTYRKIWEKSPGAVVCLPAERDWKGIEAARVAFSVLLNGTWRPAKLSGSLVPGEPAVLDVDVNGGVGQ